MKKVLMLLIVVALLVGIFPIGEVLCEEDSLPQDVTLSGEDFGSPGPAPCGGQGQGGSGGGPSPG